MAKGEASLLLRIKEMGSDAIDNVRSAITNLAAVATAAFAAISAVVYKSIQAYAEQEEATNSLTQSMVNNGIFSKELAKKYEDQATALSKLTTFADEQITAAQSILQRQIGEKEVTEQLTKATLDLAAAKKMDLASAAELVGKTIGGSVNTLQRQGIEFDNNARGAERLTAVVNALNGAVGGQAAAAAQGLGSLKQLQNAASEIFETFGSQLAPVFTVVARELTTMAYSLQNNADLFNFMKDVIVGFLQIMNGLGSAFHDISARIGASLGVIAGAASQLLSGQFANAKQTLSSGFSEIGKMGEEHEKAMLARMSALDGARETQQLEHNARTEENLRASLIRKQEMQAEQEALDAEAFVVKSEEEIARLMTQEQFKTDLALNSQLTRLNSQIKNETDHTKKMELEAQKRVLIQNQMDKNLEIAAQTKFQTDKQRRDQEVKDRDATLSTIASMSRSSNQTLASIGKAAAITQIAIETPVAIARALGAFPPPFNFVAAGLVGAAMASQAANIAGVQLAEGGIVRARPGGIQATIGEGGRDEAVIPLDQGMSQLGTTINITVNGGLLGNEAEAREFARAVDRNLLKLRQNNESVSFDGIT